MLFYHFHDAVAFFPLMLWGVEKLVSEKKRAVFALTVFINALLSYFFFVGEVIFVIVYFDDTVKDEKDIEALLNIPVIASIPKLEDDSEGGWFKWKKVK